MPAATEERTGLLIVNLGTPDAPRPREVRRYLRQFLSDPRVLDIPALPRFLLLELLILLHCQFAVDNRSLITVHFRDLIHASDTDRRRVRRLQATYASLWTDTVMAKNPGVDEPTAHGAVHAAFGLINSTPFSRSRSAIRRSKPASTLLRWRTACRPRCRR